ncbi:MAG TPA: histidine phosphatase family protein [Rhizomicrobium sp.]
MPGALLIRHAEHTLQDVVLAGRSPGIHLSARGRERARGLGRALKDEGIAAIQSSPRERCLETAEDISTALGIPIQIEAALDELDFGLWTGAKFAELDDDSAWRNWNERRSLMRPPGGESMVEAQQRILLHLEETARRGISGPVAMVTHAEIVRAALLHARGLSLDAWGTVPVPPGSFSQLEFAQLGNAAAFRGIAA